MVGGTSSPNLETEWDVGEIKVCWDVRGEKDAAWEPRNLSNDVGRGLTRGCGRFTQLFVNYYPVGALFFSLGVFQITKLYHYVPTKHKY